MATTLSKLATVIGDSPTLKINAAARALKAAGEPVVHLGGGEPTYPAASENPQNQILSFVRYSRDEESRY